MRVHHLASGVFPEYEGLNPHFRPGSRKLRYVLDTSLDNAPLGRVHRLDPGVFLPFFERLSVHSCGSGTVGSGGTRFEPSASIVTTQERIDIAHYLEHLVLDIQYGLGVGESISGVTLGTGLESTEFLTVLEAEDVKVCVFAVNAGVAMMHQALYTGAIDPRYRWVLELARWVRASGAAMRVDVSEAAQILRVDLATARYCLDALRVLQFPMGVLEESPAPVRLGPVLVVEDNDDGRAVLEAGLTTLGYDVRSAADGRTGVDILNEYGTAAAVLDVYLPDVDGVSIARWLLETQPATRLILISGGIRLADGDGLSNPAIQFLPKPFRIGALHAALQTDSLA